MLKGPIEKGAQRISDILFRGRRYPHARKEIPLRSREHSAEGSHWRQILQPIGLFACPEPNLP